MIENLALLTADWLRSFELQMMQTPMGNMYFWLVILVLVVIVAVVVPVVFLTYPARRTRPDASMPRPTPAPFPPLPANASAPSAPPKTEETSRTDDLAKALELVRPTLNDDERRVLSEIVKAGGEVLQSDLPEKSDFSKATVSKVIKSLETMGIVTREKHKWTYWVKIPDKLISRTKNA